MNADPVLTLADLESWARPGIALAVLGHPIAHSLSPAMHNAALAHLAQRDARFRDWHYFRFDVPPADLPRALALLHEKKFRGLNLTVPHKIIAFDLVADIDAAARPIGAVNTLVWTERGWRGHNTDGYGLATAVRETLDLELRGSHVILLGAGGAARSAAVECINQGCASLWIVNRTRENLNTLLDLLKPFAGREIPLCGSTLDTPLSNFPRGTIFIQATSLGLHAGDPSPIDLGKLPRPAGVFDMIYNPPETALLAQARELNIPCANGLAMLVHQGAKSLEIWTGAPTAKTAPIMLAAQAALRDI
ncbi:MAG: shikimate dehydrogenase [Verrucomicrobiota bacterium]|nr:shikimate dehydrogenase [Verrucomicrobiota bacterium]